MTFEQKRHWIAVLTIVALLTTGFAALSACAVGLWIVIRG